MVLFFKIQFYISLEGSPHHKTLQFYSYPSFCWKWHNYIWRHSAFKWPVTPIFYYWFLKFKPLSMNWQKILKSYSWELITMIVLNILNSWGCTLMVIKKLYFYHHFYKLFTLIKVLYTYCHSHMLACLYYGLLHTAWLKLTWKPCT